jgi:hypothetical protein
MSKTDQCHFPSLAGDPLVSLNPRTEQRDIWASAAGRCLKTHRVWVLIWATRNVTSTPLSSSRLGVIFLYKGTETGEFIHYNRDTAPASNPFTTMTQVISFSMLFHVLCHFQEWHPPSHLKHASKLFIQNVKNLPVSRIVMTSKWLRNQQWFFGEKVKGWRNMTSNVFSQYGILFSNDTHCNFN